MIIGLSQRLLLHKNRAYDALEHGWYSYLKKHTLVPVANKSNLDFNSLSDQLDCFIITGGDDSTIRRLTEVRLATHMIVRQKPVIGICHGAFLLTELLGGEIAEINDHIDCEHQINYFGELVTVNSYHSLAIKTLQKSATILAYDDHGNCEAWIDGKMAGIVWHPERMKDPWIPEEIELLFDK
jgi:gamma-glutamyl-gamma-aminobutyrate hydrolase PuuD